jgi:hypothetical protein
VDYRRKRGEHTPIHINGAIVEWVESFMFLGVHITKELTWFTHMPRRLKRFSICPRSSKSSTAATSRAT